MKGQVSVRARAQRIMSRQSMAAAFLVGFFGFFCSLPARAHDFWVQPAEYWLPPQSSIPITLQIGHGAEQQRSPIRLSRITRFEVVAPGGRMMDVRDQLRLGGESDDGRVHFGAAGTYLLVLETDNGGRSALPAARFNEYARAEGLMAALEQRERARQMQADGSERYGRQAKSIVQVGPIDGRSQQHITRPLGLVLEIVPERSPYAQPRPMQLPVRVLFESRPLVGALVKLTQLEHDAVPLAQQRTDRFGRASFPMPQSGTWLLNVIWAKPLPPSEEVDFETTFSSLSFGFPPGSGPPAPTQGRVGLDKP